MCAYMCIPAAVKAPEELHARSKLNFGGREGERERARERAGERETERARAIEKVFQVQNLQHRRSGPVSIVTWPQRDPSVHAHISHPISSPIYPHVEPCDFLSSYIYTRIYLCVYTYVTFAIFSSGKNHQVRRARRSHRPPERVPSRSRPSPSRAL